MLFNTLHSYWGAEPVARALLAHDYRSAELRAGHNSAPTFRSLQDSGVLSPTMPASHVVALCAIEDTAMRAAGYRPPNQPPRDNVDVLHALLRNSRRAYHQVATLRADRQWRAALGSQVVTQKVGRQCAAELGRITDLYRQALEAAACGELDLVMRKRAALVQLAALQSPSDAVLGSDHLPYVLQRVAPQTAALDAIDRRLAVMAPGVEHEALQRRATALRRALEDRVYHDAAPALAAARQSLAPGETLPHTIGASICHRVGGDISARVAALHADVAHIDAFCGGIRVSAPPNSKALTALRQLYRELWGDPGDAALSDVAAIDRRAMETLQREPVQVRQVWRIHVFVALYGYATDLYMMPMFGNDGKAVLRAQPANVDAARAAVLSGTQFIATRWLEYGRARILSKLRGLLLRLVAAYYVAAFAYSVSGQDAWANETAKSLVLAVDSEQTLRDIFNAPTDEEANVRLERYNIQMRAPRGSPLEPVVGGTDLCAALNAIDKTARQAVRDVVAVRDAARTAVRPDIGEASGVVDLTSTALRTLVAGLARQTPSYLADGDPLSAAATASQSRLFRPDTHESGMLSAALNTMLGGHAAPQTPLPSGSAAGGSKSGGGGAAAGSRSGARAADTPPAAPEAGALEGTGAERVAALPPGVEPFSLPAAIWARRLEALAAEHQADPLSTGTAEIGSLSAAERRQMLLTPWTPAKLARAAVAVAMRRVASDSPASVAALPLVLMERIVVALVAQPAMVSWLRRYGMDAHAQVADEQRAPFRLVVPVQRQRADASYMAPTEAFARELTNALIRQSPQSAPVEFVKLAHDKLNVATTEAHAAWLDVVFGPPAAPHAVLSDEEELDTLDLYLQMKALVELYALVAAGVATLAQHDQEAAAALPQSALLGGVLHFVQSFLDSALGDDVLMVLELHVDGHVLYDHFSSAVAAYAVDVVYDWPPWPHPRGAEVRARRTGAIDRQWIERAASLLWCDDVLATGAAAGDDETPKGDAVWQAIVGWTCNGTAASADELASGRPGDVLSAPVPIKVAPAAATTALAGNPTAHAISRVLWRYPRQTLGKPYRDLTRGQAQLAINDRDGAQWFDAGPMAGIDVRTQVAWSSTAAQAAFPPDPLYAFYEWRLAQMCYLEPAAARRNLLRATPLALLDQMQRATKSNGRAELLVPPFGALTYVLEWLMRNPWPSLALVRRMYDDANRAPTAPTYYLLKDAGGATAEAEAAERRAQKTRATEAARNATDAMILRVSDAYHGAVEELRLGCTNARLASVDSATLTAAVDAVVDTIRAAPRLRHADAVLLDERIEQANQGTLALTAHLDRMRLAAAPIVQAQIALSRDIVRRFLVQPP